MTHIKHPRTLLAALPLALTLIVTGCGDTGTVAEPPAEPVVEVEPGTADETEAEEAEVEEPVEYHPADCPVQWPLTGVATDEVADRPALIVKVGNDTTGRRSQEGVENADILYEVVVEGGITRLIAVFQSDVPDRVMPVRSGRPTDIPIVTPYGGLFAYSGAQGPFIQAINAAGNQSLIFDSGVAGLARADGRNDLHSVAATTATLLGMANSTRVSPPQGNMPFACDAAGSSAAEHGADARAISVRMSGGQVTNFAWDAASGTFLRSDGTTPSVQATGARLSAVNVILISAPYVNSDIPGTSPVPTAILTGSGRAVFAADGKYIEGTWQKGGDSDPFTFLDSAGQPVVFAPGNTHVQVVPDMAGGWSIS